MSSLYVVATPIGNLEDITLRALRVLREVKLIAAEDTRKTRRLLNHYAIKTPMTSYYEHNKLTKLDYILNQLKLNDVALVSEAGMPGINDPGYELIAAAATQENIKIVPIPGASAGITALAVSGLPTDKFTYIGFLPSRASARRRLLKSIANETNTIIALEAPHRLLASLKDIKDLLCDRRIAIGRELTKLYEEVFRGTVNEALKHFAVPRGEFTLVIEGSKPKEKPALTETIEKQLKQLQLTGARAKEAVAAVAMETGLPRKGLYQTWLKINDQGNKGKERVETG